MRRTEGASKVTGDLVFTEDLPVVGLAHASLVTSYVPSGAIRAVDAERARTMPGVIAVLTAADLRLGEEGPDAPLANGRVFHVGQPVAAVIAETAEAAADAAEAVEVAYDPLPIVIEVAQAVGDGAPRVLPEAASGSDEASLHGAATGPSAGEDAEQPANVTSRMEVRRGDADAAMAAADVVVGGTYVVARVHQGFLEPHVATAAPEPGGGVAVWSPTQGTGAVQDSVAMSLKIAPDRVRVVPMPVGGGFGGKIVMLEPLVAHLARAVGRPVRLTLTRNEEFLVGRPAPSSGITIELGATRDGELTALRGEVTFDNGSGTGWHAGITCELLVSTYRVPNAHVVGREVATHKLPATSYRAPGAPQAYFALESCMDELARRLEIDPIELRLRNASREGDPRGDGSPWPRIGLTECLERARAHPVYTDARADGEGVGVAVGCWPGGYGPAAAACRLERDGSLTVHLGSVDISGSDTGFINLAAETMGVAPEKVRVIKGDAASAPAAPMSAGSAITYSVGPAVVRAVLEARRQILDIAAARLEASAEDLEVEEGAVHVKGAPFRQVTFAEVAQAAGRGHGPVLAVGRHAPTAPAPMFTVHVARARVDAQTGDLRVGRYAAIHDIGHALNRPEVEGQIHGGIVQGLGRALGEEIVHDGEGQPRTATFADYVLPTADQVPPISVELVEVPSEQGPRGARGIGEPPVVPVLAAVANAICDATGRRLTSAPFQLEAVAGAGD
ncbi:MAG TPA: xanthine dehydrogenase family protein molybdopterin-binding subunit [Candidatus Dormibacteraeota bacterium]|nr:xanthine dehydrogenase family protein molybdopterin-binding subunit [Candidatus Dormibacteraeota bacterium]